MIVALAILIAALILEHGITKRIDKLLDAIKSIDDRKINSSMYEDQKEGGETSVTKEHGPWIESTLHEGETYCQHCRIRSIFRLERECDPRVVNFQNSQGAGK
jgi:hypothetical protein